jgi:hypothetical protein
MRKTRLFGAVTLGVLLGVVACQNEDLFRPYSAGPADPLFERYVSLGNSITAGYQSGGINDSTQLQSYAVLLSRSMRTPFFSPLMSRPGCPPPFTNIYLQTRVPPAVPNNCALRRTQAVPPPFINNVAVPGAEVMDAVTNLDTASNPNGLTSFFLGGYTQTQMMKKVDPTFVTVWLGNNDVLGAATAANGGDTTKITDTTLFKARYTAVLDSIGTTSAHGGVLIGVANVTLLPYFVTGTKFYRVSTGADSIAGPDPTNRQFPSNFVVAPNCAPPHGDSVLVPFPAGAARVAFARANPAAPVGVNCDDSVNVQPRELVRLKLAVTTYNTFIAAQAAARGYAFADPNALFTALPAGSIPTFPNIPTVPTPPATTPPPFPAASGSSRVPFC